MKKNLLVVALVAIVGMSAVVILWQRRELSRLREIIAGRPVEFAPAPAHPVVTAPPVEETPAAPVVAQPAAAPALVAPESKPANMFAKIGEMAKDPAFKDMIRAQQRMALDMMYGDLFKKLNLSAEDLDGLKKLMADRAVALMDGGMAMMSGDMPTAERAQKVKEAQQIKLDYDKKIEEFLGADSYAVFKDYEETQGERWQVNQFKQALSAEEALTEQQQEDLIAAMVQERRNLPNPNFMKDTTPDPSKFSQDGIAQIEKVLEQLQEKYLASAGNILSAAQLEQFKKSLDQTRAMQTMSLKMAGQMFGQQKPAPAKP